MAMNLDAPKPKKEIGIVRFALDLSHGGRLFELYQVALRVFNGNVCPTVDRQVLEPLAASATGGLLLMKFKRILYYGFFDVRHLFNYTSSHARLAFSW